MIFRKNLLFFLFFLCIIFKTNGQEANTVVSLKYILENLSTKYKIHFDYIEDEILLFKLEPPKEELILEDKLNYLQKKTGLFFKKIGGNNYSIYNNQKLDKPLCGYLIDEITNFPIENATIRFENTDVFTISNEKGYFEIPLKSSNDLLIQHINYQKIRLKTKKLYSTNCPQIKLQYSVENLKEIIANHYLASGISKKNDGTIEIKPNKFGILPGLIEPDLLQTLQQIPGINSVDETISNINVRGGTNDQNLYLWNGIRMFQTGHFFGLISAFNPSLAQNIVITKNGTSAFYGESVSSVIDISSHLMDFEKNKNSISTNLISAEFFTQFKTSKKSSFIISGRRSLTDFITTPTYNNYRDRIFQNTIVTDLSNNQTINFNTNEKFYFYDLTTQYEQKIGTKSQLNIDAIIIKNSLFINQSTVNSTKNSNLSQENFGTSFNWKTKWNENNSSKFNFYTSYYSLDSKNESIESNQVINQQNKLIDLGISLKNDFKISKTLTFLNGYQLNQISVTNNDVISLPNYTRNSVEALVTHAFIVESMLEPVNKKSFIKFGIRANYFQKFNTVIFEPRFQYNYLLNKYFRIELLGEEKSQTLSQIIDLQNDFLGIEKRRWTLANNETIPIQKNNQISLGISFKKNYWLITLDNFYKKISNITTKSQEFQNQLENINTVGNFEVYGTELLIQKRFGNFISWMSYSYNQNNYFFNELNPNVFVNNFELKHSINWAAIYEWNNFKIAFGGKWHTGKPITTPLITNIDPINPQIIYNSPNNSRLSDFFQLNFSISKKWEIDNQMILQTNFSILNLLNTKNTINRYYRINTSNNSIESVDIFALNRTPNINIKLSF